MKANPGAALVREYILRFMAVESSSSILLGICTLLALVLANGPLAEAYFGALHVQAAGLSLHHWINDGLMAIFFFLVGLEIKREIVAGELSEARKAALPVAAALGGMVVPALIYLGFNLNGGFPHGWAIPMATDIAFAVGVLSLFGNRVPLALKIFLLALAIVDDLGAVLVIATFYTSEVRLAGLLLGAAGVGVTLALRFLGISRYLLYVPIGAAVWFGILYSGVHATIGGVILGLITPYQFRRSGHAYSPVDELIHWLHPWVNYGIMPLFALANAGLAVNLSDWSSYASDPVAEGVFTGLLLGKPVGVMLFAAGAVALGVAKRPKGLTWKILFGAAVLAGIGFTMAIFIAGLALDPQHGDAAKLAILTASTVAMICGYVVLNFTLPRRP